MKNQENFDATASVWPIIRLAEGREVIAKKLEEYKSRLGKAGYHYRDTLYKIAIAQKLADTGEVNPDELSLELAREHSSINIDDFRNACAVISDYITTSGRNNFGGTRLDGVKGNDPEEPGEPDNGDGRIM